MTPNNAVEQAAMDYAMRNPAEGQPIPVPMTDKRWLGSEGWQKWALNVNKIEIHYNYNPVTGEYDDFKFK